MTGHDAPKVVQYSLVHLPAQAIKVDDLAEEDSPWEMGKKVYLKVKYMGVIDDEHIAVFIEGHGNYAVPNGIVEA